MTFTADPTARPWRGRRQSRLEAIERQLVAADASGVIQGHPYPTWSGASPVEIAGALASAIVAAHGEDWSSDEPTSVLCPRCLATVDTAARIAERNHPTAWPNPLLVEIDEALAARDTPAKRAAEGPTRA